MQYVGKTREKCVLRQVRAVKVM